MLQQQCNSSGSVSYSDLYCALCGFGPDEELPAYVHCPDHLWLVIHGHQRIVMAPAQIALVRALEEVAVAGPPGRVAVARDTSPTPPKGLAVARA